MRWFETPNFNFMGSRHTVYIISGVYILASLIAIFGYGLEYGIDFKGGKSFVLQFEQPVQVTEVRSELTEPLGGAPEVKRFGSEREILIRTDNTGAIDVVQNTIMSAMAEVFPDNNASVVKTELVGPRFAEDLKQGALKAIIFSIIIIFIYILIRFKDWRFSAGAILALVHDVTVTLGIITIFREILPFNLQIDQTIIAAFLTIVGYSINDTVVVFDRVRENLHLHKIMDYEELVNKSVNETLSRTTITSLTTLFVVAVLFLAGGEVLKGFSFSLILGIIFGTFSSIFIASAIALDLRKIYQQEKTPGTPSL